MRKTNKKPFCSRVMSYKFFRYEMRKVWRVHITEHFHIPRSIRFIYIKILILLIERCFIHSFLFFKDNEKLGLIGVAGAQFLPSNGIWWEGKNLVGKVIEYRRQNYQLLNLDQVFLWESTIFVSSGNRWFIDGHAI